MNRSIVRFCAIAALLLCAPVAPVQASLVHIGPEINVTGPIDFSIGAVGYSANTATGEFAICYANHDGFPLDRIMCRLYNANAQPLTDYLSTITDFNEVVQILDVDVADNGDIYAAITVIHNGGRTVYLAGWSRTGAELFDEFTVNEIQGALDVDVAATASGPWLLSTRVSGNFDLAVSTHEYTRTGTHVATATVKLYTNVNFSQCGVGFSSDIAANRSGDLAVTWIAPSFYSACKGTVMARTFRPGGATSVDRPLTTVVRDGAGRDASPYFLPQLADIDSGRFVLAWGNPNQIFSATVDQNATIVAPATAVTSNPEFINQFRFAANAATGDFAVNYKDTSGLCEFRTQLAIEGALNPVTRFPVGSCFTVAEYALQFHADGRLGVVRAYPTFVSLSFVDLPAQIEVNNVTVSEGNPGPGAPPSAALSVTLTKPHPNGEDVHVSYFTRNGTAIANQDFALTQDTAVFAGATAQTAKTILLPILPDTRYEDDERFTVEFELPVNAVIRNGDERASVVIVDDDNTPPITPDCDGGDALTCRTVPEPGPSESTEILIRLQMAQPVDANLQINYTTADGTAHAGSDYVARSGSVQIIAGATTAEIPLSILGDDVPEDTKTFHLHLTAPNEVDLTARDLVIHILDDALCFLEVVPTAIVSDTGGSNETLTVTTRAGCDWTVSTPDDWINITSPVSNTGSGTVALTVEPFDAPVGVFERNGTVAITLADPLHTVTVQVDQDGACVFTIDPASQQFAVAGGSGSFTVDASVPECAWVVESPAPWITILSPLEPVFGDGTVSYQIDANADEVNVEAGTRTVMLTSEQFDYEVSEAGCTYTLDQTSIAAAAAGDVSYFVDMDAPAVCQWTAISHASWILIQDGTSGSGEGQIEVFVLDNPTVQSRIGTVTIGDETLTVTQAGLECDYTLAPAAITSCPDGRAFVLDVTATDGCTWTLHKDASWVTLLEGTDGEGDDQSSGMIDLNLSELPRTSAVELRAQNIGVATTTLMQEGYLTYEIFDAARPADWSYAPDTAWTTAGSSLVGQALGQGTATALDRDVACSECEIEASVAVTTAGSSVGDVLTVFGWYRDENNHVGLAMDEFSNRWTLYQMISGTRFSVVADVAKIIPNTFYDTRLVFDGATFTAEVGGNPLLQMALQGDAPSGSAGMQLAGSNGRLSELRVTQIEAGSVAPDPDSIFAGNFETFEVANFSQCQLPN